MAALSRVDASPVTQRARGGASNLRGFGPRVATGGGGHDALRSPHPPASLARRRAAAHELGMAALCPVCGRAATPLFYSAACDWCDGLVSVPFDHGWVVWRGRPPGASEYVFRTPADAERWRVVQSLQDCPVREVLSEVPFRWRNSSGNVKDIELADRLIEIYPDHRFPAAPNRAFLAGPELSAAG